MATLKDRLNRLEKLAGLGSPQALCPECGDVPATLIIFEEHRAGGTIAYPYGPPCETCGSGMVVEIHFEEGTCRT